MPELTVFGTATCGDCARSKRLLGDQGLRFRWVDIGHDPEARAFVLASNDGRMTVPTILFSDGSTLGEPSDEDLLAKLKSLGLVAP